MTDAIWQLLYPKHGGEYGVIDLTSLIIMEQGRGIPPLHYNVQRGTYQHGETPINMRLDPRVVQVALADDHDNRSQMYYELARLMDRVNPNRNWAADGTLTKCVYRKIMPGGRKQWRSDLVTVASSVQVTSASGRFVDWGLEAGSPFTILTGADAGDYVVASVVNENTLTLTQAMTANATDIGYRAQTGRVIRDLHVVLESGPVLEDDLQEDTLALSDTLKLIAHDPVWRGAQQQSIVWVVENLANLIFYEHPNWTDRLVFPIWFGGDEIQSESSIAYLGTWPSRPMFELRGPFSRASLENLSTGTRLIMSYSASVGEVITIDLDALTVTNNYGQNLMRYMSTPYAAVDSDLVTFSLCPDPQVSGGLNHILAHISDAKVDSTRASMYWYTRYIGA